MAAFASAMSMHPVPAHAVGETAGEMLDRLDGDPDLVVCFVSSHFVGALDDMVHAMRNLLDPRVLVAVTTSGVVGGGHEVEDGPAAAVFAASLPDATVTPAALRAVDTPDGMTIAGWPDLIGDPETLLLFADPFSFPIDTFLRRLHDDRPELAVIGGMASAGPRPGTNRLVADETVIAEGAVGVFLRGASVEPVVSQGCRPVGTPFVATSTHGRFVDELGGRPAVERLQELAATASDEDRALLQHGLQLGIVVDEQQDEFARGDFLIRNVMGLDRDTGALAVGDTVEIGQTVQFQVRDAVSADEDLRALLAGRDGEGALLFTCNGRGRGLFGTPDHDAGVIAELLGPIPLAGGFCAGEVGPVGGRNFVHGFTASLALFT